MRLPRPLIDSPPRTFPPCQRSIGPRRRCRTVAGVIAFLLTCDAFAQAAPEHPGAIQPAEPSYAERWSSPEPWRTDRFYLATSAYTVHFNNDPAHNDHQHLILGEWNITERWLLGGAVFDNSFGQPSQVIYGGAKFRPIESAQPLYLKVGAGLVHGYKGQYQNKIPFNHSGVAPVILPTVGYCFTRLCSEVVIFGTAGLLLSIGITLP